MKKQTSTNTPYTVHRSVSLETLRLEIYLMLHLLVVFEVSSDLIIESQQHSRFSRVSSRWKVQVSDIPTPHYIHRRPTTREHHPANNAANKQSEAKKRATLKQYLDNSMKDAQNTNAMRVQGTSPSTSPCGDQTTNQRPTSRSPHLESLQAFHGSLGNDCVQKFTWSING